MDAIGYRNFFIIYKNNIFFELSSCSTNNSEFLLNFQYNHEQKEEHYKFFLDTKESVLYCKNKQIQNTYNYQKKLYKKYYIKNAKYEMLNGSIVRIDKKNPYEQHYYRNEIIYKSSYEGQSYHYYKNGYLFCHREINKDTYYSQIEKNKKIMEVISDENYETFYK